MKEVRYWILGILSPSFVLGYKTNFEIFTSEDEALKRKFEIQINNPNFKCDIMPNLSKEQLQNFVESSEKLESFSQMILKAEQIAENKKRRIDSQNG